MGGGREGEAPAEPPIRESGAAAVAELKLHNLHNASAAKNVASANGDCLCDAISADNKNRANLHNGQTLNPALSQREREKTPADEEPGRLLRGEFMPYIPAG